MGQLIKFKIRARPRLFSEARSVVPRTVSANPALPTRNSRICIRTSAQSAAGNIKQGALVLLQRQTTSRIAPFQGKAIKTW
ncbi:hypothetical protein MRX96_057638 [Rhipicephalus microplus]